MISPAAHVAVFSIPAAGHINPTLAIVGELVRRGHRVSYATSEEFAPRVAAAGATPVLCPSTFPSPERGEHFPLDDAVAMSDVFLNDSVAALPVLAAAFEDDRPDLVLFDYASFAGQILAKRWGVPSVRNSPTHVAGPDIAEELAPLYDFLADDPDWADHRRRFQEFLDSNGVGLPIDEFVYRGRANRYLATLPREFQKDAELLDDRYHFVGPCLDGRSFQGSWEAPADDRPVLLASLGTVYNNSLPFYRSCVEAFAGSEWHVVLATGRHIHPQDLGVLPENVELHYSVPQLQVLARADAFLTHGGMGSTLEGLYFGVPMVAVPQGFDQIDNAGILASRGLGRHLPPGEVTPQRLREEVLGLVGDTAAAERLAEIKQRIRASGGAAEAADLIEKSLAEGARGV
ncbi:macrolide family glycosyltransferase [Streptomyces sp. NPDC051994]|uniref:macrolide family glycosyltransferase n=1 Tax=unclassified Streptomyces TaxID=2593676 RepID=UPI0034259E05